MKLLGGDVGLIFGLVGARWFQGLLASLQTWAHCFQPRISSFFPNATRRFGCQSLLVCCSFA